MQIANPDGKYWHKLNGEWETEDGEYRLSFNNGSFTLDLSGKASLEAYFSCSSMLDPGAVQSFTTMLEPYRINEQFRMYPGKAAVCDANDQALYKLHFMWYTLGDTVQAKITDLYGNVDLEPVFIRIPEEEKPLPEGHWRCECGWTGSLARFCPNCGRERPE